MANSNKSSNQTIAIDCLGLSESQIRLVRSLSSTLTNLLATDNESEFFSGSADIIGICAMIINQTNFSKRTCNQKIPYSDQALEYSLDILQDKIERMKVVSYDN